MVVLLVAAIVFLFLNLSSGHRKEGLAVAEGDVSVYNGIPSDAVVVLDFKTLAEYRPMLGDTLSFAHKMLNGESGLVRLQEELLGLEELSGVPCAYSLQYSKKH